MTSIGILRAGAVSGDAGGYYVPQEGVSMRYRIAADAVLVLHLGFIAFVLFGALLALRKPIVLAAHLPAAFWGTFVEIADRVCPLTTWENTLRTAAGASGYSTSFVEHYLLNVIYPDGLTVQVQYVLAAIVIVVNGLIYGWLFCRYRHPKAWRRT